MLDGNYIKINNEAIPRPKKLDIDTKAKEKVGESEAGNDISITSRVNKRTFNLTFQLTSYWLDKLLAFAEGPTVMTFRGEDILGRWRPKKPVLVAGSEDIPGTDGLWTLTVNFFER